MILAVDLGNTTISAGFFEDGVLKKRLRFDTEPGCTEREYESVFSEVLAGAPLEGASFSSVVPRKEAPIRAALTALLGRPPVEVSDKLQAGLRFDAYETQNIGADRIADLVAVKALLGAPAVVFDLGTCTTVSVLSPDCMFLGGMILPGVQLSLDAMHQRAAKLPALQADAPASLIGQDTESCMKSGAIIGAAAAIDGLSARIEEALGCAVPVMVTGGMGKLVVPWCRRRVTYDPDLLLKGLAMLCTKEVCKIQ